SAVGAHKACAGIGALGDMCGVWRRRFRGHIEGLVISHVTLEVNPTQPGTRAVSDFSVQVTGLAVPAFKALLVISMLPAFAFTATWFKSELTEILCGSPRNTRPLAGKPFAPITPRVVRVNAWASNFCTR